MSLWGLVSSLSDSGAAFIASTARDIAEFKHALHDETKELHSQHSTALAPHSDGALHDSAVAAEADDGSAQKPTTEGGGGSQSSVASSLSSLTSNIERLGGRVLHSMLPAVFGHDNDSNGQAAAAATAGTAGTATELRAASSHSGRGNSLSGGKASATGGFDHRLLAAMRDRSTYDSDPVDPRTGQVTAAYASFAASFSSDCSSRDEAELGLEWSGLRATHPSIRHWYEQLVETGQVDERAFWCRYSFARQSLHDDERRRQKLADRLAGMTSQQQQQQRQQQRAEGDDELQWDEEEDTSEAELVEPQQPRPPQRHQQQHEQQQQPNDTSRQRANQQTVASDELSEQEPRPATHSSPPEESRQSQPLHQLAVPPADDSISSAGEREEAAADGDAGSDGDGELLSSSPVSSEGSGELIDAQEAAAAAAALDGDGDGSHEAQPASAEERLRVRLHGSHSIAPRGQAVMAATSARTADGDEDRHRESDYDDWE